MMPLLGYPLATVFHPWLLLGCVGFGLTLVLLAAPVPAARGRRAGLTDCAAL